MKALLVVLLSFGSLSTSAGPTPEILSLESRSEVQVEKNKKEKALAPVKERSKDGRAALIIFGILFFWTGLACLMLAGIFSALSLGALPLLIAGLVLLILGIVFWAMAREIRRSNARDRRERRREKIKRTRG